MIRRAMAVRGQHGQIAKNSAENIGHNTMKLAGLMNFGAVEVVRRVAMRTYASVAAGAAKLFAHG